MLRQAAGTGALLSRELAGSGLLRRLSGPAGAWTLLCGFTVRAHRAATQRRRLFARQRGTARRSLARAPWALLDGLPRSTRALLCGFAGWTGAVGSRALLREFAGLTGRGNHALRWRFAKPTARSGVLLWRFARPTPRSGVLLRGFTGPTGGSRTGALLEWELTRLSGAGVLLRELTGPRGGTGVLDTRRLDRCPRIRGVPGLTLLGPLIWGAVSGRPRSTVVLRAGPTSRLPRNHRSGPSGRNPAIIGLLVDTGISTSMPDARVAESGRGAGGGGSRCSGRRRAILGARRHSVSVDSRHIGTAGPVVGVPRHTPLGSAAGPVVVVARYTLVTWAGTKGELVIGVSRSALVGGPAGRVRAGFERVPRHALVEGISPTTFRWRRPLGGVPRRAGSIDGGIAGQRSIGGDGLLGIE
ncbi:hypothetical protein [Nocardia mangyaensis]|uniref:hypothetical protein n=1 Tax=Nocardia mangyaensis TaxID=2213200 RepID=UPI0026771983|nr:hypothetical protein [Nocardia mangyaensis]MDO3647439.1 hypothetical protein [Nocardia mangyaensis]